MMILPISGSVLCSAILLITGVTCGATGPERIKVSSLDDAGPGTLREALDRLNQGGGGQVEFTVGEGLIALKSALPEVRRDVVLAGPAHGTMRISGQGEWPIFSFAEGTTSRLSGLVLTRALAAGYRNGGAISNAGTLVVADCVLEGSRNRYGWGGAIYNRGQLTLLGCSFSENEALGEPGGDSSPGDPFLTPGWHGPGGGGAGLGGAIFHDVGTLTATRCTFARNLATGGTGGRYGEAAGGSGRGGGPSGGAPATADARAGNGGFGSGGGGGRGRDNLVGGWGGIGGGHATSVSSGHLEWGFGAGSPTYFLATGAGGGAGLGAAIFARSGVVTLEGCRFEGNTAQGGGGGDGVTGGGTGGFGMGAGVFSVAASVQFGRTVWVQNGARGGAGGIPSDPFGGEYTGQGGGAEGAAIGAFGGRIWIEEAVLATNWVEGGTGGSAKNGGAGGWTQGGAVVSYGGQGEVARSLFVGNRANGGAAGGGRRYAGAPGNASGGAWAILGGSVTIENCTLSGNTVQGADGSSGGLFFPDGPVGQSHGGALVLASLTTGERYPLLLEGEILRPAALVARLATTHDPVSAFLWSTFPPNARVSLVIGTTNGPVSSLTTELLRETLNTFLYEPSSLRTTPFWDSARFAGVVLRPETRDLAASNPVGDSLLRLHRLLLEDAYPEDFPRLPSIERTEPRVHLRYSTVASNVAVQGVLRGSMVPPRTNGPVGGGGLSNAGGRLTLEAVLAAGNFAATNADVEGTLISLAPNLIQRPGNATGFEASDLIDLDPKLGPLGDFGGPTWSHALLAGSPAIDVAKSGTVPSTDQRGVSRPQGLGSDLGAFELDSVEPPHARIASVRIESGAQLVLRVVTPSSTGFMLEFSNDLSNWSPVDVVPAGDTYRVALAPDRGFYRLREVETAP